MTQGANPFQVQRSVRRPWRRYVDKLTEHRPALHAYCRRLTGNVWDGEDLVQDTLVRVFSLLGKTDTQLENPKGYLIRTAANLWIDRVRRSARQQAGLPRVFWWFLKGQAGVRAEEQKAGWCSGDGRGVGGTPYPP